MQVPTHYISVVHFNEVCNARYADGFHRPLDPPEVAGLGTVGRIQKAIIGRWGTSDMGYPT